MVNPKFLVENGYVHKPDSRGIVIRSRYSASAYCICGLRFHTGFHQLTADAANSDLLEMIANCQRCKEIVNAAKD